MQDNLRDYKTLGLAHVSSRAVAGLEPPLELLRTLVVHHGRLDRPRVHFFLFVPIHTPIAERRNPDPEVHLNVYAAVHHTYVDNAATLREGHRVPP